MTEPITPETKVSKLLDSYPELEEVLIGLAPAFGKLRNPVLRKSVAKVATLRQAAKVGGVSLAKMINLLRAKAGISERLAEGDPTSSTLGEKPDWAAADHVCKSLDVRPMLEEGKHPLSLVLAALGELKGGQVLELVAPFAPIPLIDVATAKGFEAWWVEEATELVKVYMRPLGSAGGDTVLTPLE